MGTGFEIKDGELILRINPSVYPIERVYATMYIFLDKYYFMLDGDKEKELIVTIRPKKKDANLDEFAKHFLEELLSISNYFMQFEKNKEIIQMVLQRALRSLEPTPLTKEEEAALEKVLSHSQ